MPARNFSKHDDDDECECESKTNPMWEFASDYPVIAFLIVGSICYALVEIVAIIHLGHPVNLNF